MSVQYTRSNYSSSIICMLLTLCIALYLALTMLVFSDFFLSQVPLFRFSITEQPLQWCGIVLRTAPLHLCQGIGSRFSWSWRYSRWCRRAMEVGTIRWLRWETVLALDLPLGPIACRNLLPSGLHLGFSSRGEGQMWQLPNQGEGEGYNIISIVVYRRANAPPPTPAPKCTPDHVYYAGLKILTFTWFSGKV